MDAVADGESCVIAGIMEHIEEAGIHSGDSACVTPPYSLEDELIERLKQNTYALARELHVIGLMNIQYAIKNDIIYVLEVNPRASRTVPFISKATGVPWAKVAAKVMVGKTLAELGITKEIEVRHIAVKESVFPFNRFYGVDTVLGPEMKSTGEVMGIDMDFGLAFAKSQMAAGVSIPLKGRVFISVMNKDKRHIVFIAKKLTDLGFEIMATKGTAKVLGKQRDSRANGFQGGRRQAGYRRPDQERRDRPCHQYPQRKETEGRQGDHPESIGGAQHSLHHHPLRRFGCCQWY